MAENQEVLNLKQKNRELEKKNRQLKKEVKNTEEDRDAAEYARAKLIDETKALVNDIEEPITSILLRLQKFRKKAHAFDYQ